VSSNVKTYIAALFLSVIAFSTAAAAAASVVAVRVHFGFIVALLSATRRLGVLVTTLVPAAILWKHALEGR